MKNVIDKVTDPVPGRTTKQKECVIFYLPSGVYLRRAAPCPSWHIIVSNFSRPESRGPRSNIHNCLRLPSIRLMPACTAPGLPPGRWTEDWFKKCSQSAPRANVVNYIRSSTATCKSRIRGSNVRSGKKITKRTPWRDRKRGKRTQNTVYEKTP